MPKSSCVHVRRGWEPVFATVELKTRNNGDPVTIELCAPCGSHVSGALFVLGFTDEHLADFIAEMAHRQVMSQTRT